MQHTLDSHTRQLAKHLLGLRVLLASLAVGCSGEAPTEADPPLRGVSEASHPATPEAAARDLCGEPLSHDGKLLELGGNFLITALRQSPDRILAQGLGAWALWDREGGAVVARGTFSRWNGSVDIVGDVALVPSTAGHELRSVRDGSLQGAIALPNESDAARLAMDGSYVYTIGPRELKVWDLHGKQLRSHAAAPWVDYVYAAPDELRYPQGSPARAIETLSIATGEIHTSPPFEGNLVAWFRSGTHFFTRERSGDSEILVRVYTKDAALVRAVSVPQTGASVLTGGEGDLFWLRPADRDWNTRVYRLGVTAPILTFKGVPVSYSWKSPAAVFQNDATTFSVLDLGSGEPKLVRHTVPPHVAHDARDVPVHADADGRLVYAEGAVIHDAVQRGPDGRPRALGCPEVTHLVGWGERFATASADGVTRLYAYRSEKPELVWKLTSFTVDELAFMDDGRTLAVYGRDEQAGQDPRATTVLRTFSFDEDHHVERELSRSAMPAWQFNRTVLTTPLGTNYVLFGCAKTAPLAADCVWQLMASDGNVLWSHIAPHPGPFPLLSPRGLRVAVEGYSSPGVTDILEDGTRKAQLPGIHPLLWLDEEHLLVGKAPSVEAPSIIDLSGATVATFSTPLVGSPRLGSGGLLHDDERVYGRDGKVIWSLAQVGRTSAPSGQGLRTIVAGRFAFIDQGGLYVEPITPDEE